MKKLLTLIMAGCIALSLAACTPKGAPSSTPSTGNSGALSGANSDNSAVDKDMAVKSNMGKVTSVTGNEIEINLVKEPEGAMPPDSSDGGMKVEGGITDAVAMTPAVAAGSAVAGGAEQRTEIELTGDIKAFVIPAGMPIKDAAGSEKQLSDIKKGSLLNVLVDKDGNVTEVYLYE